MPQVFRKNLTENHLAALQTVARLSNATPQALTHALAFGNRDYWRNYCNDLVRLDLLTAKLIYAASLVRGVGKKGRKIGTLFALTERGAMTLAEATDQDPATIYYPKGGITATSPFHFPHRAAFLELLAEFIRLEQQSERLTLPNGDTQPTIELLEIIPYFRQDGSKRLGEGRPLIAVELPSATPNGKPLSLIPDGIVRLRVGTKVRLIALEFHKETDTKKIIHQIRQHTKAMERGVFAQRYHHPSTNFLLSIHQDEDRLKHVIQRLRNGEIENFDRYQQGVLFGSLATILNEGIKRNMYHVNGQAGHLFDI